MADHFIGCELGSNEATVMTEGSSSTAALDVELRITTSAANASKAAALECATLILQRLIAQTWPPA